METWDAIRSRRNVRSYGEGAIAPEHLDRILEAARRTPSAGNQQAWDFVVCTDREQLAQLARVWRSRRPRRPLGGDDRAGGATLRRRPHPRPDPVRPGPGDHEHHGGRRRPGHRQRPFGVADQDLARRLLGFPEDRFCAVLITLGVPADRPLTPIQRPDRRPFTDVVHRGHW